MTITKDTAPLTTRLSRGIALAEGRFEEIQRTAPWVWSVPRCTGPRRHTVDLRDGTCSCPDRVPEGERCKHEHAARYVKAKTATCSGCGERLRHPELLEVTEDHGSLTWFPGDLLCYACALHHGVL